MSRPCHWWEWLMSALSTKWTLLDTARVNFLDLARINLFKFFIPDNKLGTHIRGVNWSNFGEFFFWFDFNWYLYLLDWLEIGNLHKAANGPNYKKYGTKSEMSHIFSYDPAFEMSTSSSSFSSSFFSTVMTLAVSSLVITWAWTWKLKSNHICTGARSLCSLLTKYINYSIGIVY